MSNEDLGLGSGSKVRYLNRDVYTVLDSEYSQDSPKREVHRSLDSIC